MHSMRCTPEPLGRSKALCGQAHSESFGPQMHSAATKALHRCTLEPLGLRKHCARALRKHLGARKHCASNICHRRSDRCGYISHCGQGVHIIHVSLPFSKAMVTPRLCLCNSLIHKPNGMAGSVSTPTPTLNEFQLISKLQVHLAVQHYQQVSI